MEFNFRKFLEQNTVGYHNDTSGGAYLSSDQTGSEMSNTMGFDGRPLHLPSYDFALPAVIKTGKVVFIEKNKNPISIHLSDGTKLYLLYPEYRRIKGSEPEMGRTVTVEFQRNAKDDSMQTSKINSITVF